MDLQHLKQWQKHQQKNESDQQSDLTRLLLNDCYYQQQHHSNCSELPLFTSPDQSSAKLNLHSAPPTTHSSYFSMAQWQELEVQACVYRHLIAGAPVPPQLLHLVKKSLILNSQSSSPYYHSSPYHTALMQSGGYWGRSGMDPEPGRCRRTDGKKWRCSRDVVGGYKYCERHMHRGRNRSRKPVEVPSTAVAPLAPNNNTNQSFAAQPPTATPFRLSGPSHSFDLLPLNHRPSETENEVLYRMPKSEPSENNESSSSQVLRPFFDDWPRSLQESESLGTSLSISVPGNQSSDVCLKLSTGGARGNPGPEGNVKREQPQLQWSSSTSPWGTNQMGGPLAEAFRSSTTTSMPTSFLHQQHGVENYINS
ncbi:Growth-regulating factor [Heracleum sosnowskyi]|uniref:Growth-regulating factor n=1 Tax=Heracleum sosnowskyi TaxID=360622 RepID=A0AAD8J0P7_9APIA|nr:Growth-regulating factor [Heracleum sosnowskyi]